MQGYGWNFATVGNSLANNSHVLSPCKLVSKGKLGWLRGGHGVTGGVVHYGGYVLGRSGLVGQTNFSCFLNLTCDVDYAGLVGF